MDEAVKSEMQKIVEAADNLGPKHEELQGMAALAMAFPAGVIHQMRAAAALYVSRMMEEAREATQRKEYREKEPKLTRAYQRAEKALLENPRDVRRINAFEKAKAAKAALVWPKHSKRHDEARSLACRVADIVVDAFKGGEGFRKQASMHRRIENTAFAAHALLRTVIYSHVGDLSEFDESPEAFREMIASTGLSSKSVEAFVALYKASKMLDEPIADSSQPLPENSEAILSED